MTPLKKMSFNITKFQPLSALGKLPSAPTSTLSDLQQMKDPLDNLKEKQICYNRTSSLFWYYAQPEPLQDRI